MASGSSFKSFAEVLGDEKSQVLNQPAHGGRPLTALCFSGGGIRSATFNLGLIQGLAKRDLLDKFDYLSTVSGGGYIGAWLTTWCRHCPGGISEVQRRLAGKAAGDDDQGGRPEPRQIHHLRDYSNYLTPRLGLGSADGLVTMATWVRNFLLNGVQIWPLLMGFLLLPLVLARAAFSTAPPTSSLAGHGLLGLGTLCLAIALVSLLYRVNFDGDAAFLPPRPSSPLPAMTLAPWYTIPMTLAMALLLTGWVLLLTSESKESVQWILAGHGYRIGIGLLALFVGCGILSRILRWRAGTAPLPTPAALLKPTIAAVLAAAVESQLIHAILTLDPLWRWSETIVGFGDEARLLDVHATWAAPDAAHAVAWQSLLLFLVLAYPITLLAQIAANWVFTAVTSRSLDDPSREWLARADGIQLSLAVGFAAWFALCYLSALGLDWLLGNVRVRSEPWTWMATALGPAISLLGVWFAQSARTAGAKERKGETSPSFKERVIDLAGSLSMPLAAVLILATLAYGAYLLLNMSVASLRDEPTKSLIQVLPAATQPHGQAVGSDALCTPEALQTFCVSTEVLLREWLTMAAGRTYWPEYLVLVALAGLGWLAGAFLTANRYSLFGFYRERLARAYLGGGRMDRRHPDPFTRFDSKDNYGFAEAAQRPLHVVNATLNLGSSGDLSWQERRAMSFTFSPLHCGAADLPLKDGRPGGAFRPTALYSDGLSLAGAIAISGAAANPNMGYHHSPAISFLLSLCNVRLGAWLGNPAGQHAWKMKHPGTLREPSGIFLLKEAMGKLSPWSSWVNLSDGGHFENLGVYEMVRRGCKLIVVGDGSADPAGNYDDLGRALRLMRTDFGVEIEELGTNRIPSPPTEPVPAERQQDRCRWRLFRIVYPAGFDTPGTIPWEDLPENDSDRYGYLLYLKTAYLGDEPQDVRYYASTAPAFPHESTGDQFFSESQFEAYRKLGEWTLARSGTGDMSPDAKFRFFLQALTRSGTPAV